MLSMAVIDRLISAVHGCHCQASYRQLCEKEDEANALMLNGEDMIARCREKDALRLRQTLCYRTSYRRPRRRRTRERFGRKKER